jgi:hypothetical protein
MSFQLSEITVDQSVNNNLSNLNNSSNSAPPGTETSQNIIPNNTNVLTLGNQSSRFGHCYLGPNSALIDEIPLTTTSDSLIIGSVDKPAILYIPSGSVQLTTVPISVDASGNILLPQATKIGGINPGTLKILGTILNQSEFPMYPTNVNLGDCYILGPDLWTCISAVPDQFGNYQWENVGQIVGEQGPQGPTGPQGYSDVPIPDPTTNPFGSYMFWGLSAGWIIDGLTVKLGYQANYESTYLESVSLGQSANQITNISPVTPFYNYSIAIGCASGNQYQGQFCISIGSGSGYNSQGTNSICIGYNAGTNMQGTNSVALGGYAGGQSQGQNSVAIGWQTGVGAQGQNSVAIGYITGQTNQGANSVAIGSTAGNVNQGQNSIAIGNSAGNANQGQNSIAIGNFSGSINQGSYSIAIGNNTGTTFQPANSIIINATSLPLSVLKHPGFYVAPINVNDTVIFPTNYYPLYYNTSTTEIQAYPNGEIGFNNGQGPLYILSDPIFPDAQIIGSNAIQSVPNSNTPAGNWNGRIQSLNSYTTPSSISFVVGAGPRMLTGSYNAVVGFSLNPSDNSTTQTTSGYFDAAFFINGDSIQIISYNNSNTPGITVYTNLTTNPLLSIIFDGSYFNYFINNVQVYSAQLTKSIPPQLVSLNPKQPFNYYFVASFQTGTGSIQMQILNIEFGPYSPLPILPLFSGNITGTAGWRIVTNSTISSLVINNIYYIPQGGEISTITTVDLNTYYCIFSFVGPSFNPTTIPLPPVSTANTINFYISPENSSSPLPINVFRIVLYNYTIYFVDNSGSSPVYTNICNYRVGDIISIESLPTYPGRIGFISLYVNQTYVFSPMSKFIRFPSDTNYFAYIQNNASLGIQVQNPVYYRYF